MSTSTNLGGRGPLLLGITWAEAFLATLLLLVRIRTAAFSAKVSPHQIFGLRWDFLWFVAGYVLAMCAQSFLTISILYGTGNHEDQLTYPQVVLSNLWSWIAQVVAISATTVARIAVAAFVLAVQGQTRTKLKWILYVAVGASALINAVEIVLIMLQCSPVQKLWDPQVPGNCALIEICSQVGYLQGSIGAAADITVALYPIWIVVRLQQMRLILKVGLCVAMGGGVFAGIAGINKTIAIHLITETSDISYAIFGLLAWVWTEMWFINIFGSLPILKSLFSRLREIARTAVSKSSGRHSTVNSRFQPEDIKLQQRDKIYRFQTQVGRHDYAVKETGSNESEEEILPRDGHIMVTRDLMVRSESNV